MEQSFFKDGQPLPTQIYSGNQYRRNTPQLDDGKPDFSGEPPVVSLFEYWRVLVRRKGAIGLFSSLGLLAAIVVTLPQTPVYRARFALEVQNVNDDYLNTKQVNPVAETSSSVNMLTDVQTQMKILQSENLVDRVIRKLEATGKLTLGVPAKSILERIFRSASGSQPVDLEELFRQKAMKSLSVRQVGQTRIIELFFTSADSRLSAEFVNTLASEYVESNMESRWKMTESTSVWLSRQLNDMRAKLEGSEDALQRYARRSGLLFTTPTSGTFDKVNVSEDKLRQVQEQLSRAQADRAVAQSRLEIARSVPPETLGEVLDDETLRELQGKLTDLRRQLAELSTTYTASHERMQRVQAQIAPLQAAFNVTRDTILSRIKTDFDTAIRREALLQADYGKQSALVTNEGEKTLQYNILKREVDSNRQLYESMLQQVKAASVASAIRASNIRIVDPAKPPRDPYAPNLKLNSILGLLSGLLFGVVFVIIYEGSNRTLQQPGDAKLWISLPELGVIPKETTGSSRRLTLSSRRGLSTQITSIEPRMLAESFRTVLTSVMFSGENQDRPRVLVFTSPSPMEGKTTVTANLGIAVAETRQKVLIIDADLRKPRMHKIFDLPNTYGLSSLLQEYASSDVGAENFVQKTELPGLDVLCSGPLISTPANLLYSPKICDLLSKFKQDYDMVLVDTPPSLYMSDARLIGRWADAVVIITRAGRTTREAALKIYERFASDRTPVLGAILNHWDPGSASRDHSLAYRYGDKS